MEILLHKGPTMSQKLLLEIERLRDELNTVLEQDSLKADQDKILDLSKKLDQLILEYIKKI